MSDDSNAQAQSGDAAEPADQVDPELKRAIATADAGERERLLRETIRDKASALLDATMGDDSNFVENGLNSLAALELAKTLMNLTDLEIPMVAIVENPTPAELSRYVAAELGPVERAMS